MPRTRSLAWSELKIGLLTIAALVIFAITVFMVTGGKGFFWQRYTLKTTFGNAAGLKPGSPVRLAGVEVGSVQSVSILKDQVDVTFQVNKQWRDQITTESVARLGSVSLLGESAVDMNPSTQGTPIPEYGYVKSAKPPAQIADLTESASAGIEEINGLVKDIRAGRGTAGKLMTDDELYNEMSRFVKSANDVTASIKSGKGVVGKLLNDPVSAKAMQDSLNNLQQMTARINAGQGSLGKLLKDEQFANALTGATSNFQTLTDRINRGEGTVGKLMTDDALYKKFTEMTSRLDELVTKVNEGQGTVGMLMKDKQLYENMNTAVAEFRALLAEIRKDPKKYLNVKVSIW
jgi:phospholipid/cholesterol/gamma-HCH transport system substrate-binding protein